MYEMGLSTKFINAIKKLYTGNKSRVWNGEFTSEEFEVNEGVRQGCLLSPDLFAIFINDLPDAIGVGFNFTDLVISLLMYADDVVLVAKSPVQLQLMINRLVRYCQKWNFAINHEKSKIMVFRKGGRLAKAERWVFEGKNIEVVNQYRYLGVVFTTKNSLEVHFAQKLSTAKLCLTGVWNSLLFNSLVASSAKVKLFRATARAIMCYGEQFWGWKKYEVIEKLQRFFLKILLRLPKITPNYILACETNATSLYVGTLRSHFDYVYRVLTSYPETRLPRIIATKIVNMKVQWYQEWISLSRKCGLELDFSLNSMLTWKEQFEQLIVSINNLESAEHLARASDSNRHKLYKELDLVNMPSLYSEERSVRKISLILKARAELIPKTGRNWEENFEPDECALCNAKKAENIVHLMGECYAYKEIRRHIFGLDSLDRQQVISALNGHMVNWDDLFKYLQTALQRRSGLLDLMIH